MFSFKKLLLLILLTFILFTQKAAAVDTSSAIIGQEWKCLSTSSGWKHTTSGSIDYFSITISGKNLKVGEDMYLVMCIDGASGFECTTSNSTYDKDIIKLGSQASKVPDIITFENGSKFQTSTGSINTWVRYNYNLCTSKGGNYCNYVHRAPYIFAVRLLKNESVDLSGDQKSIQQMSYIETLEETSGNCVPLNWIDSTGTLTPAPTSITIFDPEGRVFDAKSLETIPDVQIKILDSQKKALNIIGVPNPIYTDSQSGEYSFLVPEGDYYLNTVLPTNYSFTTGTGQIDRNYQKAYSKIYQQNEVVTEKIDTPEEVKQGYPNPEHRDIALVPKGDPLRRTLQIISHGEIRIGSKTIVRGKVSHPLTEINLKQSEKTLFRQLADTYGKYEFTIDTAKIDPTQKLLLEAIKTDLAADSASSSAGFLSTLIKKLFFNIQIFAAPKQIQKTYLSLDPILPNLQGYAYDDKGNLLANAEVNIKLNKADNQVFYKTTTDKNGLLKVDTKNLPALPYVIEYSKQGSTTSTTSVQSAVSFAQKNKSYLAKNNINLMKISVSPTAKVTKKLNQTSGSSVSSLDNLNNMASVKTGKSNSTQASSPFGLILVIVMLVFILTGIIVYLFLRYRKQNIPPAY